MSSKMTASQKQFIEEMGNLYATYGLNRLNGMLIGLLLCCEEPLSLDEICKHLNRSKGLISEATRRLNSSGYIKKMEGPESRKDYYIADYDIFINVFHFNMTTVRKNLSIADHFLHLMKTGGKTSPRWKENLEVMEMFYTNMNEYYEGFETRWNELKKKITTH